MSGLTHLGTSLIVAPHPDDEVLGCGGTIARLADAGQDVHVAIVTRGYEPAFSDELVQTVRAELVEAHRILGVTKCHFLDLPAAALDTLPGSELNAAIGGLVQEVSPDTLFLPFVGDIHRDHQLIFTAGLVAARPRSLKVPQRIYAYETLSETNWAAPGVTETFAPNVFFDIGATLDRKLKAFACFKSQVKDFPDERSLKTIEALATLRGSTVYRSSAEGFILLRETT
ncbi:MAG: PIG-L deacetylase family protein [Erythrobacter sp.]|uniref:PIG-L deacetylase family protein n=1 Tax=Erythrobacter sp. TaxID=1042 RepID=UPI00260AEC45|nr:PIG-L deacetylase family protein [Erythrobacter sp.]MDJ0978695.1 PIG-L deacetylase family protein [Erythrobacter sp.]